MKAMSTLLFRPIARDGRMPYGQIYLCVAISNVRSHLHDMTQVDTMGLGRLLLCC